MDWLCEDLLLLALDAGQGRLGRTYAISYGLMGAELIRLAARGQIDVVDDQVAVRSQAPTGDVELDAALARIGEPGSPLRPGEWVARPRPRICGRYLEQLTATGVISEQTRFGTTWFRTTRWRITQTGRLAEARQRLDLIACSAGPVDLSQAAYAGLACAVGLDRLLYPGRHRLAERDRLREIAAGRWTTSPAMANDSADATVASPDARSGPGRAAVDAATFAAIRAAIDAVADAAVAATMAGVRVISSPASLLASFETQQPQAFAGKLHLNETSSGWTGPPEHQHAIGFLPTQIRRTSMAHRCHDDLLAWRRSRALAAWRSDVAMISLPGRRQNVREQC